MKSKVRILLIGPNGQMGRAVSAAAESELDFVIAATGVNDPGYSATDPAHLALSRARVVCQ